MTTESSTTDWGGPTNGGNPDGGSTTDVAKNQAADVADSAKGAGQHVAGTAKDEAGNVATEAGRQARDLFGQARTEVGRQAADQQQRVADGLRSLGDELSSMAQRSEQTGVATDLTRQVSTKVHDVADWLEQRDPGSLLDEVKTLARHRPGAFLGLALGAGLVAGRLTRGLKDESAQDDSPAPRPSYTGEHSSPATGYSVPTGTPGTGGHGSNPYGAYPGEAVDPVVSTEPVTERPYIETATPGLSEERRP